MIKWGTIEPVERAFYWAQLHLPARGRWKAKTMPPEVVQMDDGRLLLAGGDIPAYPTDTGEEWTILKRVEGP